MLLILVSSIPCFAIKGTILRKYEDRAVAWRIAEIQNHCTILSNQLSTTNYLNEPIVEIANAELSLLSSVYGGRIFVIDEDYKIVKDTYGVEAGKTIISPDVIQCFSGASTSRYDAEGNYIEITTPITEKVEDKIQVKGVILTSVSSDIIRETLTELEVKADLMCIMVLIVIAAVGFFVASVMTEPLGKIATTIEDITEGFENDNLDVDTYTETKKISDAFNKMRARMKVLDDSRQEFVSNVSHELKTPLTSMKVLADSLLAQDDVPVELYKEFMGDIAEEIERENKIITDLLSLVKMDKTAADMNIKAENINDVV